MCKKEEMRLKSDGENISSITRGQVWILSSLYWNSNYKISHINLNNEASEAVGSRYRVADFTLTEEIKRK